MRPDKATATRLVSLVRVLWAASIITTATAVGAYSGWQDHGITGALEVGLASFVAGCCLSSPSLLLQLLAYAVFPD
ncbi:MULTISPECIES: hypothetical protein [Ensifer]|uniref:hypothetical protein n=1 Tax=Ensifer TaxID=106591 RepID=UPI00080756E5|nr:hypothetical protein [Ensifer adhaerens]